MSNLKNILKSFEIRNNLCPEVWDTTKGKYQLKPKIREKLLTIAYEFFDSLGVDVIISDITFTGSLANYNWSNFSDIDLHLIANFEQFSEEDLPLYEELFMLKKSIFNDKHNIKILGYDVELYVQDQNEEHTSTGVYSVLNNNWIVEPKKESKDIDVSFIKKKSENWMKEIDSVIELSKGESLEDAKNLIKKFKEKIKKYRSCGLEKGGEYSIENLVFKVLRRNGYIEKLFNTSNKLVDDKLSIKEDEVKDPKLTDTQKSKDIEPDIEKLYDTLENIDTVIKQQKPGEYSYSKDIEAIQIALDLLGYPLPKYGVDGKYGPETAAAVDQFKKDNNVEDKEDLNESIGKRLITESVDIGGIDELCYNPVTKAGGTLGFGFDRGRKGPMNWGNHDTHLHLGFTNREVALDVIRKAKELDLRPAENWSTEASGRVKPVHTNNSFHYQIFDGEPVVSAGLDIWDEYGKKTPNLEKLIKYIVDTYMGKDIPVTPIVGFDNGKDKKKYKDKLYLPTIQNVLGAILPVDIFGQEKESFVGPEMVDKLIEKLKEKDVKSTDVQKYTQVKMDFVDGKVEVKGNFNSRQLINIKLLLDKMKQAGITNPYAQVGILSVVGKECNFIPKNEICYDNTDNSRIREVFGRRVKRFNDTELDELKKDCPEFFDVVYGKDAGFKWKTGNTEKGDGYKYRGRGFNGITFKSNYKKMGDLVGMDLVTNPEILNNPEIAADVAIKFFTANAKNNIPNFTDKEDAIEFFASLNAGGGRSGHLDSALKSGQRFDVIA